MIAWQDSWLNIMFFFARSSRIQILFEPILILSITSVFASAISSSVSTSEVVCPSFLELDFPAVEGSELPCAPAHRVDLQVHCDEVTLDRPEVGTGFSVIC